jgi:CTD small phosphatase-like protein 2
VLKFKIRPYLTEFLEFATQNFEVVIYTASSHAYCSNLLKNLDFDETLFAKVLTRESCLQTKNGFFIKDLRIIGDRSLDNILIIDNLVHSFGFQLDNGFPILEWRGDPEDRELLHMIEFLQPYIEADSIPELNKKNLRLRDLVRVSREELIV